VIKENRGEGGGRADHDDIGFPAKAQKALKRMIDEGCPCDTYNIALR